MIETMIAGQKRKAPWSMGSRLGARTSNKVIILEQTDGPSVDISTPRAAENVVFPDMQSFEQAFPKPRGMTAFRRHGSKVLSILGFGTRTGTGSSAGTPITASERDNAMVIARDAAALTSPNEPRSLSPLKLYSERRVVTPITPNGNLFTIPLIETPETCRAFTSSGNEQLNELQQPRVISLDISKRNMSGGLRQSRSMPGLAHQLSHKISTTFGNPTIVHRPNMRSRPSLNSMAVTAATASTTPTAAEASPVSGTDLSSMFLSGSTSPVELSTAKTSLDSNRASAKHKNLKHRSEKAVTQGCLPAVDEESLCETPLTPIPESPVTVKPTVRTVESTANAKIFFETHFNPILSEHASPRTLRRQELEVRLLSDQISPEQQTSERRAWAQEESDYLRQARVLKSKNKQGSRGVAIAGYEVVRILGKGSFGVVRLVREKSEDDDNQSVEVIREDPRNFKNVIKSTLEGQKIGQQRYSVKVKREVYAMKVIRKSEMLRSSQEGHLRAERDFLVASEKSRWVVPLIASFQDNTNLYLVMEFMIGGDFLGLLIRKEQIRESKTQWYIAEMVLCIEEAHRLKWIHRDVKPDNFLISASGHLKISDFGLAFDGHWSHDQSYYNNHRYSLLEKLGIKIEGDSIDLAESMKVAASRKLADILMRGKDRAGKIRHEKPENNEPDHLNERILQWRNKHGKRKLAKSVVGTSQYMAPEIIRGELYDGRCDWWSVAIIMFECLYGKTPFVDEDRHRTKLKILNHKDEFYFPSTKSTNKQYKVSPEAKDLIARMLQEKQERLSSKKYWLNDREQSKRAKSSSNTQSKDFPGHFVFPDDATDIKAHPFFRGVPWERMHETKPPWVPQVKDKYDTQWFDEDDGPISDVDDASSTSSIQEQQLVAQEAYEKGIAAAYAEEIAKANGRVDCMHVVDNILKAETEKQIEAIAGESPRDITLVGKKPVKEKKRPRDRILRDKSVAKEAMELRKRGAFLGYTYRRPRTIMANIENERCFMGECASKGKGDSLSRRTRNLSIN